VGATAGTGARRVVVGVGTNVGDGVMTLAFRGGLVTSKDETEHELTKVFHFKKSRLSKSGLVGYLPLGILGINTRLSPWGLPLSFRTKRKVEYPSWRDVVTRAKTAATTMWIM
jgi:hypothetical protein